MEMAKRIPRHREGTKQIYFWDEAFVKEKLVAKVKATGIPYWTASDYLRELVRRDLGIVPDPTEPAQESLSPRKKARRVA